MNHNIVCIDPSLSCTAVVINDSKAVFTTENTAFTKRLKLTTWFEVCQPYTDIHCHSFDKTKKSFSDSEQSKFVSYTEVVDTIVLFVKGNLIPGTDTRVYIEGYSFSSAAGPLIDLVTFGTLLRLKLRAIGCNNIITIPPSELKLYAAKLTYPSVMEGKKEVWRNHEGVSGGKFKKHEMYKALIENDTLQCEWVKMLREYASDILARSSIPKPIEDLNDAKMMYEIVISDKYL
jgi:hypothetical protein